MRLLKDDVRQFAEQVCWLAALRNLRKFAKICSRKACKLVDFNILYWLEE